MKLASYVANGKDAFGVVTGDGVVTMNGRLGGRYASLRDALTADGLAAIRAAAKDARPDHKLARRALPAGDPEPREDPLRRHQLPLARRRDRARAAEAAEHVHPSRQHAHRPRRRDDPPVGVAPFRLRGRVRARDRPRRPAHPGRARARPRRRLHLLRRRQRARLPEILRHLGQEFPRHRSARTLDRHHRRDPGPDPPDA